MATYILISSFTVGSGGATTMTFSSIPQTFTDLLLKISSRNTTGGADNHRITFNGNTTSYSFRSLEGNGSSVSSANASNRVVGVINGSSSTALTFSSNDIYLPNYTSSNGKSFLTDVVSENNGVTAFQQFYANLWNDTASITSIEIDANTLTFAEYTTAYLYGISNA